MDLENVTISKSSKGIFNVYNYKEYKINSIYNYQKINSLFKNFNTLSFLTLVTKYEDLINNGYNYFLLKESLHLMLSFPFFLF